MLMWLLFGFIVGILANIVSPNSSSFLGTVLLSMLGAFLGGFLASAYLNNAAVLSILAVASGTFILLVLERMLLRRNS